MALRHRLHGLGADRRVPRRTFPPVTRNSWRRATSTLGVVRPRRPASLAIVPRCGCSRPIPSPGAGVLAAALGLVVVLVTPTVRADQLDAEVSDDERGYAPVQELSYEAILDAPDLAAHAATLRLRVALHNASGSPRDVVHTLAIPGGAELVGLSIARDGTWHGGAATGVLAESGQRDAGTVWARTIDPMQAADQPAAEIVAFGIDGESTLQVELELRVFPLLRNGRWELDLPSHGPHSPQLSTARRVLVRGLPAGRSFWVDDRSSGTEPALVTDAIDAVTVAWPARRTEPGALVGRYEVVPGPAGFDDGRFRLVLRAGNAPAAPPDHITFVIDRSRSTAPLMHRDASRVITGLLAALPATASFDAIGFARTAAPLLAGDVKRHGVRDEAARAQLTAALDVVDRAQGTDLQAALALAATRSAEVGARRSMIVVVTDGMLPASLDTTAMREAYIAAARGSRPELLFVVDDPLFAQRGLAADHPVATTAAALGARISLETLAHIPDDDVLRLLAAPMVIGGLDVDLPPNMSLDAPLPTGLVAGNALVLTGRYHGKAARRVVVRGRAGAQPLLRRISADVGQPQSEAFVATLSGTLDDARDEGLVRPQWLRARQQRTAREGVAQGGRSRQRKGFLDEKIFRNYLTTRVLPRARACYNRALFRAADQGGRVVLEMEVGKGEVIRAGVRDPTLVHGDAELLECLGEAAWALDVPAAKMDEKIYVVRYPLRLVAPTQGGKPGHVDTIDKGLLEVLLAQPIVPVRGK